MGQKLHRLLFLLLIFSSGLQAQDIALYKQFNGRFDFLFAGNTLNTFENNLDENCTMLTSSSANLTLENGNTLISAYLYWAGSGTGHPHVKLNGIDITSQRSFGFFQNELDYFCEFADVTNLVLGIGNGSYTLSELDLQYLLTPDAYCNNRTNFGGWTLVVVYENQSLPLNQLNIYDGLQGVSRTQNDLSLTLNSINVIDNNGAKIGFVAWEGDEELDNNETLKINGNTLSNALNPPTNAFNGSNTFTGSSTLYNMDLDAYDIENFIAVGSSSALITMTSSADFVMISTIVTKLNSQLPDATIAIDEILYACNSREITVNYTVSNVNSTASMPAGVPIAVYTDGIFAASAVTTQPLAIGESYSATLTFTVPAGVAMNFELVFSIDDNGMRIGTINETNENNNQDSDAAALLPDPEFNPVPPVVACNQGLGMATFDFSAHARAISTNPLHEVAFFATYDDAENNVNQILNTNAYNTMSPDEIFVRITDELGCISITSISLLARNCPPIIYNFVSANNDGANDTFFIEGLRGIFTGFELAVYNRWGVLIWEGNNNVPDWDGIATKGPIVGGGTVPDGTYYYVLHLNDSDYPQPFTGFVYVTR